MVGSNVRWRAATGGGILRKANMTMAAMNRCAESASSGRRYGTALLILLSLVLSACGGGDTATTTAPAIDLTRESTLDDSDENTRSANDGDTADSDTTVEAPAPAEEPTAAPQAQERTIEDVQASTIKIAAEGAFQPVGDSGQIVGGWSGTGFIINDEGYAVTNNHVVTGAAILEVSIPGRDETVNARVLGVSECSDLAVIDLEGSGYPWLEFRTDPVNPGLSVFAAGYPGSGIDGGSIDARDYTVTGGVVSNTTGTGDTQGSAVETVIEHDAKIRGGNSGGPLVDEQARVVGINYYGGDTDDFNLAIAAQEAQDIIEALQLGNVESLGMNGEAFANDELSGVWVQGIESGSAADRAGVLPGDIILSMEDLPLATDGTMSAYCDIVRSHSADDVISIEVLRLATEELLEGQLNGQPLAQAFSFAQELADDMAPTDGSSGPAGGDTYADYEFITDDSGAVGVEVPASWGDRDGTVNEDFGASIWASPDLQAFSDTWDVPGIVVEASYDLGPDDHDAVLDAFNPDCTSDGRDFFQTTDEAFAGRWEFWSNCGGGDTSVLTLAASPPAGGLVVRMFVQVVGAPDIDAADRALMSFDAALTN